MSATLDRTAALAWVERRLAESAADSRLLLLGLPVPAVAPETVFGSATGEPGIFWQPRRQQSWVGLGAAALLVGAGPDRFRQIRLGADRHRLQVEAWAGGPCPKPRWFGGFAFAPGQCSLVPWVGFGDASFVLPRFLYERTGERGALVIASALADRADAARRAEFCRALQAVLTACFGSLPRHADQPRRASLGEAAEPTERDYRERVLAIQRVIAQGRLAKVVAARRLVIDLPDEPACATVLGALRRHDPDSIVFGFRFGSGCFVGASPERLVRRAGAEVETEAVAGSAPVDGPASPLRLLSSTKNRWEHQLVVDTLHQRLAPLCARLELPPAPSVRTLRHVLHLHTPIQGLLQQPRHVLELVEQLHPSPAVGGVPTQGAADWILEHEPHARGWYSAPVGWFGPEGDGDFAVALRSGLFVGKRAYLFAGSGIVSRSDAEEELLETELKFSTLRRALGVESP